MRTAAISDLKNRLSHYLRQVARGEPVTILDRGRPIAQLTPLPTLHDTLRQLAAQGLARPPARRLPDSFWKRPLPRSKRSVLEALLSDRDERLR